MALNARKFKDRLLTYVLWSSMILVIIVLLSILVFIVTQGIGAISIEF